MLEASQQEVPRKGTEMSHIVEEETGTTTPRSRHPHNGYYAGDFSAVPFQAPDLRSLLKHVENAA